MKKKRYDKLSHQWKVMTDGLLNKAALPAAADLVSRASTVLVIHAVENAGYHDVTGNTKAGIAASTYFRGNMLDLITADYAMLTGGVNVTRKTLRKGERYKLPYFASGMKNETFPRFGTGGGGYFGEERAADQLSRYHPAEIVSLRLVCGTSYSSYLEQVRGLNVLHDTVSKAGGILAKTMRTVQRDWFGQARSLKAVISASRIKRMSHLPRLAKI